jgi:hypothetical protein
MADVTSSDHHSSPWAQRGFILAAAFIAGLVLLGLALLVIGTGGDDSTGGGNDHSNGRPGAATPARKDPNASVCGLPAGSQQVPAVPPETRWELVGTIAAPTEPKTIGPGIQEGKRRLCFAHSPTGALFAAVNFVATTQAANGAPGIVRELTAEGAARDKSIEEAGSGGYASSGGVQVAGFRVTSYSGSETTVDLAFTVRDKGYAHVPLSMRWERSDWKVVIATPEGPYAGFEGLDNLSGFIPWSGT